MMDVKDKIGNLLCVLGDTAAEVAARLLQEGCFGSPYSIGACPVARYLQQRVGGDVRVGVRYAFVCGNPGTVAVPRPVSAFIRKFDRIAYPFLLSYPG